MPLWPDGWVRWRAKSDNPVKKSSVFSFKGRSDEHHLLYIQNKWPELLLSSKHTHEKNKTMKKEKFLMEKNSHYLETSLFASPASSTNAFNMSA